MVDVGDVALKIAGRDAGKLCVVVDIIDNNIVLIDGDVRRRKCNTSHLEFLDKKAKIKKGAATADAIKSLKDSGFSFTEVKKGNRKERKEKPKRLRKSGKKSETLKKQNKGK